MLTRIAFALSLLPVILTDPVQAGHTAGTRWWQDGNGNPDPTVTFYAYGSGWTDLAFERLDGAADEWFAYTTWKARVERWTSGVVTSPPDNKRIYRATPDTSPATCTVNFTQAVSTCITGYPGFAQRIRTAYTTYNKDFPYYFGTTSQCLDNSCIDFEGVATHEFGHPAGLVEGTPDASFTAGETG